MAIQVITYKNSAEIARLDKSNYLSNRTDMSNYIKIDGQQNILFPQFYINSTTEPTFNYVHIPDFNRYYFVKSKEWVSNNMWLITLEVDTLFSHKNDILTLEAYVSRSQSEYDAEITDNFSPVKASTKLTVSPLSSAYSYDTTSANSTWNNYGNIMKNTAAVYIVGVNVSYFTYTGSTNKSYPPEGLLYIKCTYNGYRTLIERLKYFSADFEGTITGLSQFADIVKSVYVLPYEPVGLGKIGTLNQYSKVSGSIIDASLTLDFGEYSVVDNTKTPTFMWRVPIDMNIDFPYLNTAPFREVSCEFWPLGVCSIDTSVMTGLGDPRMYVCVWCETSSLTGQTQFYYGAMSEDANFSLDNVKSKCRIPLGQTSIKYDLPIEGGNSSSVNIVESSAATISKIAGQASAASITGALGAGLLDWAANLTQFPPTFDVSGNVATTLVSPGPRLLIMEKEQLPIPETIVGRPLYQTRVLSTLSGYTKVHDIHMEGLPDTIAEECDIIARYLKAGVILP